MGFPEDLALKVQGMLLLEILRISVSVLGARF